MSLYDQNSTSNTYNPWYAPGGPSVPTVTAPTRQVGSTPTISSPINQFVWITNPGTVEMWPVAAGSEMTFIDNEAMILYVKRVDEYNHPQKIRKFKLTEIDDTKTNSDPPAPAIDMEELKRFLSNEVDRAVSSKIASVFATTYTPSSITEAVNV